MPFATAADIALGTRAYRIETNEDSAIKTRYPTRARDDSTAPPEGFCDLVVDTQTLLTARRELIGTHRRRFAVQVDGLIWFDPVAYAGVRLIDAEKGADLTCLVARWLIDLNSEQTQFELMG